MLARWLKSAAFVAFAEGRSVGIRPVALLPADLQAKLEATTRVVMLSHQTAFKQRKHPEIKASQYALIQGILLEGEIHMDRDRHIVAAKVLDQWYVVVVKATADRRELYLQSFRRSDWKNVAKIRLRSTLIRGG